MPRRSVMNWGAPPCKCTPQRPLGEAASGRSRYHTWVPSGDQEGCTQHPPVVSGRANGGDVGLGMGSSVGAGVAVDAETLAVVVAGAPVAVAAASVSGGIGDDGTAVSQAANTSASPSTSVRRRVEVEVGRFTGRPTQPARGAGSG